MTRSHHKLAVVFGLMLLLVSELGFSREFFITEVSTRLKDDVYLMNAHVEYNLSHTAAEALDNGVPITMELHVKVRRKGAWPWEPRIVHNRFYSVIRYQPLSELFQVEQVLTGKKTNYETREAAVEALGDLSNLPIIKVKQLTLGEDYEIKVFAELDKDSLPLPLRPLAYFKPSWKLSSKWTRWPLKP